MPHATDTVWGCVDEGGGYHPAADDDRDDRVCMVCVAAFPAGVGHAFDTIDRVWLADAAGVRVGAAMDGENIFGLSNAQLLMKFVMFMECCIVFVVARGL